MHSLRQNAKEMQRMGLGVRSVGDRGEGLIVLNIGLGLKFMHSSQTIKETASKLMVQVM